MRSTHIDSALTSYYSSTICPYRLPYAFVALIPPIARNALRILIALQNDPVTPAADKDDMKFDDINLNDDKNAPKLDLDFGLGGSATSDKKSGGGFSFGGGWGGGWGSTGNSWGFGGAGAEENKEEKPAEESWNFTPSTKTKDKKKKNTGFDFDFGDGLGGDGIAEDDLGLGTKAMEEKPVEEDPW